MSSHIYHPDSLEVGLVDGCPRCEEHAEHPFESLDNEHLVQLFNRVMANPRSGRTQNEQQAMNVIDEHIRRSRTLGVALAVKGLTDVTINRGG